jgi:hypothetical protein
MDKTAKYDYLQALEQAVQDDVDENDSQYDPGAVSEAERLAAHAQPPVTKGRWYACRKRSI